MPEPGRKKDRFYIAATSSMIDPFRLVLKEGDIFGVFDRFGDILPLGKNEMGLYHKGTRFLSLFEIKVNGARPLFLSSSVDAGNLMLTVDLTNPDIHTGDGNYIAKDSIHIMRSRILFERRCLEHVRFKNFGNERISFLLDVCIDADFKDIFEVRGFKRNRRGRKRRPRRRADELRMEYDGLDGVRRATLFKFSRAPDRSEARDFYFNIDLEPEGTETLSFTIDCVTDEARAPSLGFSGTLSRGKRRYELLNRRTASIDTSNAQFNGSLARSSADINMMLTKTEFGTYPYGGIPWFCTPFGRDGIITALETLWINPLLAKGVLGYLSALQAKTLDPLRAAEPGKIMHEKRSGELAALNEIPFGLYYGSVDSTPLYLVLAAAYWRRTGDAEFIRRIWGNIEAALEWMREYGDADDDGFLEYTPHEKGLRNQGWKDSQDSVFHKDGSLAGGSIALCEVQAYLYAAKTGIAPLAGMLGRHALSERLLMEAEELKARFNETFWDEEAGCYVLALDGHKRPCRVVTSNAGHALFCGIADPERAAKVARTLTSGMSFSGWGIRTVSAAERRYNPMSYHNGSVWPHDNAIVAAGLASYGFRDAFNATFTGIFSASLSMEFQRLPELFCGFHKREGVAPTLYPVACSPQTWASGALMMLLQSSLGLHFEAERNMLLFKRPSLPPFLDYVHIKNLALNSHREIDILVSRYDEDIAVEALNKPPELNIIIMK